MRYQKLIAEVEVEISEAKVADKEDQHRGARACLLRVQKIIEDQLKGEFEDEGHC